MPISQTELHDLLHDAFPDASIEIQDLAGDDDHWSTTIKCPSFHGKSRIEQHRAVQSAVAGRDIHALAIKTSAL